MSLYLRRLAALAFALPAAAAAQEEEDGAPPAVTYPSLPDRAAGAAGFVPPGWRLEASAMGARSASIVIESSPLMASCSPTPPDRNSARFQS